MQRVNEFQFYELAIAIHHLVEADPSAKYSEIWLDWGGSAQKLNSIFRQRALEFCLEAATELYSAIGEVVPHDFAEAIKKFQDLTLPDQEIGWESVAPIRQAAAKFETILAAELSNSDTYWVSPRGTHKTSMLMRSAHSLPPDSVNKYYPSTAADFDEAGRCWLFDLYTAAGFHLMRATETVLRDYYRRVTGKEVKNKFRHWGAYLDTLKKCPAASPKVIGFLEHIKDNYRNPITHPEQNLSADDAQVLFGVSVGAISMIVAEINTRTATGELLPLTRNNALTDGNSV